MSTDSNRIESVASIIKESRGIVSLTGAGISTSAGIPDFRSPEEGLWAKDPSKMMLFTDVGFASNPKGFYEFGREILPGFQNARPTLAHRFLSRLEQEDSFGLKCVITQNIDGLHQKAGSKNVMEMHGGLSTGRCTSRTCPKEFGLEDIIRRVEEGELPPLCPECGAVIRPDIVLFGEELPGGAYQRAVEYLKHCDLLLVMGSSLVVYPVADMPEVAMGHGARLIIINLQPTQYDSRADAAIRLPLDEAAEKLMETLGMAV
ncbi:MAG: Sir2 family NAD-dependent protein deacetylase [Candidatus Brocadiales bacterium]|nr:Sir2 family NAD-dependent protein deacetylase [Candidatus Bathyanammoxibius amoris]